MLITISLTIFVFFKSHMGTPLDWNFFTLKKKSHFHLLLGQTRARKKSSSELDTRYPIPRCFSPWSFLTHIKNPMGLEGFFWMEFLFVGQKTVAWIDLALNSVSENQSKLAQRFFIMFRTIWQRDVFDSSFMIANDFNWSQTPVGTGFFFRVDPLPSGYGWSEVSEWKSCFDEAQNQATSSLGVCANRYARISCVSKLLWV